MQSLDFVALIHHFRFVGWVLVKGGTATEGAGVFNTSLTTLF